MNGTKIMSAVLLPSQTLPIRFCSRVQNLIDAIDVARDRGGGDDSENAKSILTAGYECS